MRNIRNHDHTSYAQNELPFVLTILPDGDAVRFSDVNWWSDCVQGVPSVCILGEKLFRARHAYDNRSKTWYPKNDDKLLANICLKINYKLEGRYHRVQYGLGLGDGETIIVGADVTHGGKGLDQGCPSMAGVVACRGDKKSDYLASARIQSNNTEFIEHLEDMMVERLEQYKIAKRPIQTTLLVVGKRHHARFYPNPNDKKSNLKAGACVDEEVIAPNQFAFYLQSHDSPLGTARTGHYVVVVDDCEYGAQEL
ncbi:hypothetical protein G7Y89_g3969 [Cudoniella acicularis]|uniref:Piwi domain-containing protein n=1 Tax=Cudoniella acicularis TaxID=354080 RepID=A0A8H4W4Q7_9HELO|nr:hypothetical protein G7Y89_g3969 [Cudoniella acicularis]